MVDPENRLDRIEAIVESNSKSIQALTDDIAEMRRDRDVMYNLMSDLTAKQISAYTIMKNLDDRQNQLTNQQQQLIEIQKHSSRQQEQITEILRRLTDNEK
jgi:phosphoribosyl-ATP pyrophosphohydrolase